MKLIDGKKIAAQALENLKPKVAGRSLHLAAVLVGGTPELRKFVDLKKKAAESIGVTFSLYEFDAAPGSQEQLLESLRWIADDPMIHGILVELPLPEGYDTQKVLDMVPPAKDVDVLNSSMKDIFYKAAPDILPPSVQALKMALEHHGISVRGKKAAVFGYGTLVGKPVAHWLGKQGAGISIIDERTKDPGRASRQADIVVSGVGKPGLVTGDMVKEGVIVVDYGYGKEDGAMKGDVDFDSVAPKASLITPVPGGMGPLVVAAVLENLATLAMRDPKGVS